jgi:hypothetical protein
LEEENVFLHGYNIKTALVASHQSRKNQLNHLCISLCLETCNSPPKKQISYDCSGVSTFGGDYDNVLYFIKVAQGLAPGYHDWSLREFLDYMVRHSLVD